MRCRAIYSEADLFAFAAAPIALPRPRAAPPKAWAVPLARNAPAAPADTAGIAGMHPTVMRTAASIDMVLGYSVASDSRDAHVCNNQAGTSAIRCTASTSRVIHECLAQKNRRKSYDLGQILASSQLP